MTDRNTADRELYNELCCYTLTHGDPRFIHQHVVDAYTAQTATAETKPIGIAFALIGLYLHIEMNYTGRQVQLAHMALGRKKKKWPMFDLPEFRGEIAAADVMREPPGERRDAMITAWCASVWRAYSESRVAVIALVREARREISALTIRRS